MKNKEEVRCFKWYKNDRTCDICPYDNECKYEYDLHNLKDNLKFKHCENRLLLSSTLSSWRCRKFTFCNDEQIELCYAKEIENFKRKSKLNNLKY